MNQSDRPHSPASRDLNLISAASASACRRSADQYRRVSIAEPHVPQMECPKCRTTNVFGFFPLAIRGIGIIARPRRQSRSPSAPDPLCGGFGPRPDVEPVAAVWRWDAVAGADLGPLGIRARRARPAAVVEPVPALAAGATRRPSGRATARSPRRASIVVAITAACGRPPRSNRRSVRAPRPHLGVGRAPAAQQRTKDHREDAAQVVELAHRPRGRALVSCPPTRRGSEVLRGRPDHHQFTSTCAGCESA